MGTELLNVASPDCAEGFFAGAAARCVRLHRAAGLGDLRAVLELRAAARDGGGPAVTLDLLGHSTRGHHLLRLGTTAIDMLHPPVARFFRELAAEDVMGRAGIVRVRLLGCETAVTEAGRRTLRMLAYTLRVPVYGTLVPLMKSHSGPDGFDPVFGHVLVEAAYL
ncbi:hypothetical protein Val02_02370 [Virgisporangium aliadipatigenens]|uniref:DUF4347 domain-containing protein n=1 Tax=Virgisporangium aliadipatigenens TaxID=741659 RepID=A0A8J3YE62_9ACTN|nr:hypothetical protein [Virgisporangium aliadipatigenens]GIJ43351.1 hypothetical protein Val02_02370 [Virgisporangium aliadipatigenens]